ncbi:MAG: hypothetical protein AB8G16_03750 [Gammaproteobacteria bacterium]
MMSVFAKSLLVLLLALLGISSHTAGLSVPYSQDSAITAENYAYAKLNSDPIAAVSLWHPDVVAKVGGPKEALTRMEGVVASILEQRTPADRIELAQPVPVGRTEELGTVIYLVRGQFRQLGYPADVNFPLHFFVVRNAQDEPWSVIDTGCINEAIVLSVFPSFDARAFQSAMKRPFRVHSTVNLKAQ